MERCEIEFTEVEGQHGCEIEFTEVEGQHGCEIELRRLRVSMDISVWVWDG